MNAPFSSFPATSGDCNTNSPDAHGDDPLIDPATGRSPILVPGENDVVGAYRAQARAHAC